MLYNFRIQIFNDDYFINFLTPLPNNFEDTENLKILMHNPMDICVYKLEYNVLDCIMIRNKWNYFIKQYTIIIYYI